MGGYSLASIYFISGNCQTVVYGTPPALLQNGIWRHPFHFSSNVRYAFSCLTNVAVLTLSFFFQASFDENSHFIIAMLR